MKRLSDMSRVLLLVGLFVVATGCDPIRSVSGTVESTPVETPTDQDADIYDSGQPVADADIEYICPDRSGSPLRGANSDWNGEFEYSDIGYWHGDCRFRVTHPDYYPQYFRVDELCPVAEPENTCGSVVLRAELLPRGAENDKDADDRAAAAVEHLPPRTLKPDPLPPPSPPAIDESPGEALANLGLTLVVLPLATPAFMFMSIPALGVGGTYFMGGYFGLMALTVAAFSFPSSRVHPYLTLAAIPPVLALGATSYYNFRYARVHSSTRRFWMNVAGWNGFVIGMGLSALTLSLLPSEEDSGEASSTNVQDLQFGVTGSGLFLQGRF